jgi:hypothetical protein
MAVLLAEPRHFEYGWLLPDVVAAAATLMFAFQNA